MVLVYAQMAAATPKIPGDVTNAAKTTPEEAKSLTDQLAAMSISGTATVCTATAPQASMLADAHLPPLLTDSEIDSLLIEATPGQSVCANASHCIVRQQCSSIRMPAVQEGGECLLCMRDRVQRLIYKLNHA